MNLVQKIIPVLNRNNITVKSKTFSWKYYSWAVAKFCPEYIDPKKFNWEEHSYSIIINCPEKLDTNKANLENITDHLPEYKGISLEYLKTKSLLKKI